MIDTILKKMPSARWYAPPVLLSNPHVMTLFCGKLLKNAGLQFRRECVKMPDGGVVGLDWVDDPMFTPETPTLVLFHGLVGGSTEAYIQHVVVAAKKKAFRSVVVNFRGASDLELLTPKAYSCSYTDDVHLVSQHVRRSLPRAPIIAVAFSLGANILTKYLGEAGLNAPYCAALTFSNPFIGVSKRAPLPWLYDRGLTSNLIKFATRHKHMIKRHPSINWNQVKKCKSVDEFDTEVTIKVFNHESVQAYHASSHCERWIPLIRVPTLFVNAYDDPIVPGIEIPHRDVFDANPNIAVLITECGGHVAWLKSHAWPTSWMNDVATDFVSAVTS